MPSTVNILGVAVRPVSLARAVALMTCWIDQGRRVQVHLFTVHSLMECRHNPLLRRLVNLTDSAFPDGMPLVWLCRFLGQKEVTRVYGPDLICLLSAFGCWRLPAFLLRRCTRRC